jgi:3-dehydroquinate synthase
LPKLFVQTRTEPHLSTVFIGAQVEEAATVCRENGYPKVGLVFSENTRAIAQRAATSLKGAGVDFEKICIKDSEKSKDLGNAVALLHRMRVAGLDRHCALVAVGGGVLGDVCGYAASTYMRGIPVVQVPTTLLSMVDSAVGGKTGVNLDGKNMVGTFHPADAVIIDFSTLDTLPAEEYRQGLAEIAKAACIGDEGLFEFLKANAGKILARDKDALSHAVGEALKVKARIVESDPRESVAGQDESSRMLLNFGHSFGHAIEAESGYSVRHGDAVALGLVAAAFASGEVCGLAQEDVERIKKLLLGFGLPLEVSLDRNKLALRMRSDKKNRAGEATLVLLKSIGRPQVAKSVPESVILAALGAITA